VIRLRATRLYRIIPLTAVIAALAVLILQPGAGLAAQSTATIALAAMDVDTSGNAPTFVGPIESCRRVEPGATVDVDLVVKEIPPDRPLTAIQFTIFYDAAVVNVTGRDVNLMLSAIPDSAGISFPPLTDPLPDADGGFQAAGIDFSQTARETGPGVLLRLTLKAVGSGLSVLSPNASNEALLIFDHANSQIGIDTINSAFLAVGIDCPTEAPPVLSAFPGSLPAPARGFNPPAAQATPAGITPTPVNVGDVTPTPADGEGGEDGEDSSPTPTDGPNNPGGDGSGGDDTNDSAAVWPFVLVAGIAGAAAIGGATYLYRRRQAERQQR
jgi:hypothetical protein